MTRAEHYACRYAESDKSYDSLVAVIEAAMKEAANRERARCIRAIWSEHERDAQRLDDLATWEVAGSYVRAIAGHEAGDGG